MAYDFSNVSDEELERMAAQSGTTPRGASAAPSKPLSEWTDEELEAYAKATDAQPSQEDQRPIVGRAQTLVTADEAKGMDSMSGVYKAALEAQRDGGPTAYADDGSFMNWLGNLKNAVSHYSFGRVVSRNISMNNQDILRGTVRKGGVEVPLTELDDGELDYLVDAAGWNGAGAYFRRFLGPWARSSEGLMQEWDRTEGAKYADPTERKAARVKYAQDLARMNVEQQESERNAAQTELKERPKAFGAGAVGGLVTNGAYMIPYLLPHSHGIMAGIIEFSDRAQELLGDRYETDEDGNIRIAAERDSTGKAIAKGAARGVIAPLIESVGGELTAKGLGKAAEMTIGKIPIFKKAGKAVVESAAGKAVSRWMKSMSRFGKATGMQSMPVEMIEELEDQISDAALALDKRDSETTGDMLGRAAGAFGDFMKPESLLDLTESMLLMQMIGGGIAHASDKSRARVPDLVLERVAGLDKKTLRDYTPEQKWAAYKSYVDKMSEDEIVEKFGKGAKAISELTSLVRKGATFDLKNEISAYKDADGNPVKPHEFEVQLGADGKPAFRQSIRTDTVTGATTVQNSMTDEKAGVTVVDNGDGKFQVIDEFHPERSKFTDDFNDAIQTANEYSLNNQRSILENRVKEDYFRSLVEGENAKFKRPAMAAHTVGDVLRAVSQDIKEQGNFHGITNLSQLFITDESGNVTYPPMLRVGNESMGFTCPDGTIVGILDNIGTAADMRRVLAHESGHAAGKGDAKARAEMLSRISPDTEYGAELERLREINERDGLGYSEERLREEAFSQWLERRGHNPSIGQRITHALFGKMGKLNDADLEVIASRIERDSAGANGKIENMPTDINVETTPVEGETATETTGNTNEAGGGANGKINGHVVPDGATDAQRHSLEAQYNENDNIVNIAILQDGTMKVKLRRVLNGKEVFVDDYYDAEGKWKEKTNETGNGTDEAQPQPEQGSDVRQGQEGPEVARPQPAEPPRGEAPDAGVVEATTEAAASPVREDSSSRPEQKPVAERNIVEKLTDQAPVQELPVAEVVNDDSRIPNFKEGANPETGEVEPLTGEPYDLVSNPIVVMEFKDGKKVVVTGRHRLALYKRSGRKTIAARVIREADGWTVDDAKAIDAIGNIIDEKGTVKDYVNYFNNAKPTRAEAKADGFLDRPKGQRAFSIFEGASEATKSVIDWNGTGGDGLISADQAGIIAEAAPKDANKRNGAVQRILVQKALAGLRGKKLGILARSLAEEAKTRKDTPNVGGEMQLDLFTSEDDQKLLALEEKRSDYRVKKSEEYGRIAEVLRTALAKGGKLDLNADYAKELGITDPNDRKQLAAARDKAVERANYWETAISLDEADKAAMDADINAAAEAGAKKREAAKAKVEAIKAKREGKVVVSKNATTTPAPKAGKAVETVEDRVRRVNANKDTAFLTRDGAEKAIESMREFVPSALNATSFNELLKALSDFQAEWAKDNAKWERMKSRWGVGRYAETAEEKALQRKVNGGRGVARTIKDILEYGFPEEYAAFKTLPAQEQLRKYGLDVKESDGRISVTGNTYPLRDQIKEFGFKWDGERKEWFKTSEKPPVSAPAKTEATTPAATGAADMFEDKAVYNKSKAALDEIDFMDPRLNPDSVPDRKEDRPFDVLLPNGKIETIKAARSRSQAQSYVDNVKNGRIDDKRFANGGTVYERGRAKYAIMALKEERDKQLKALGHGAIDEATRRYPDATRDSGADFARALRAGVTHARTKREALAAVQAANREGVASGRGVPGLSGVVAGKAQRVVERGWRYYDDGTVVVPIFDGTPKKAKKAFADILLANVAFGGYKVTGYAEDAKGDLYAVLNGPKTESIPEPLFEDKARFLKGHGFTEDSDTRFGRGLWMKGEGYNSLVVDDEKLRLANTPDGKHVAIHADIAASEFVNFADPAFDPERFGRLVTGVGRLVDALAEGGHKDFKSLATFIYKEDPAKYERAKPVLQDIWNAVARARKLERISDDDAEKIFGIIETPQGGNNEPTERNGSGGEHGNDGGVRAATGGGDQPGGVLAGGRVRPENSDERVGSVGTGDVPGQVRPVAQNGTSEEKPAGAGEAAGGVGAVADSTGHEDGEHATGGDSSPDTTPPRIKKRAKNAADDTKVNPLRRDFVMTKAVEDAILEKSTAQRVRNNLAAIRLIRELKARDYVATPAEQETLAKFVGWGGLREAVFKWGLERAYDLERSGDAEGSRRILRRENVSQSAYELHKELRQVLNDEEYESAKASSSTAFYTPVEFVRILHDALRRIGVKGGRFLGPSAGMGNFASAEGDYEKPTNWQLVEKDVTTGEMLKALFPNQRVTIGGFEDTKFPDGFFDLAIDNVPYADVPISDRSLSSKMFKIHDYFFAKTLAKLRPGGVMAFLTSTGTLDKTSPILRQFLTEHGGRIVGAVRLPNGFFAENAGTDVASDLVVVQKVEGRPDNSAFERSEQYGTTTEWVRRKGQVQKPLTYNGYFKDHPEQVVGKMEVASGQFGPTLKYTMPLENVGPGEKGLWEQMNDAVSRAVAHIDKDALLKSATVAKPQEVRAPVYDDEGLRQGNVTMKDGKPFIKSGEMLEPIELPKDRSLSKELAKRMRTPKQIMEGLIGLRKAMRDVIDAQMEESDTVEIDLEPLWAKLNEVYDAFVKKNGNLHDKWITPFALLDKADGNRMLALERVVKDENGKPKVVKSDIFSKRVISRGQRATKADTPRDALVISYSETGTIDVPRIAELLGVNQDTAIARLKENGDAFENPQTGRLEPSWEYLSGRVRAKLAAARAAVEAGEESYRANVEALEKAQPPMVRLEDTEIKFGATWVDPECMKDFLRDAFGSENMQIALAKNEVTGQWNIEFGRVLNADPWGETSWNPKEFVSRVLNHGSMNHYETDPIDKKKYLDERRTEANKLAAEKLHHAFSQFIQSSDKWAEPSYERYNAVMTDMVEIKLPNNILPFRASGMSEDALGKLFENGDPKTPKKGREYQSDVIARGVLGGNSLCLAHCVGAGKTLEMQSIGVLGRHLGLFKKPMYVVPNHMLEQFTNEFVEAFPNANILKMGEDDVKPGNRRAFFAQVANGDWDAIVVKHSTFSKKLGMSSEYQKKFLEAQLKDLEEAIEAMRDAGEKISVDQANKKKERLEAKLEQLANKENHDSQIVPFEELGVDQLFVDEAHNFKGMPITTKQGRKGGLSQGDSQRAVDMQMKTEYIQSLHGGNRGVVFATGTPLSNAPVVESYVMLKYLAPNKLEEQGLKHFDDFVDAFGRITTEVEFSIDGKTMTEKEKVSAFVNIPEMMKLFRSVVDIVNPDRLDIPRPKPKYHMIDVDMTPTQAAIMEMVAREATIPGGREHPNKLLDLSAIAKMACLTPRLLGYEDGGNKVIRAVAEIKKVYDETSDNRGAQLVFTDIFNESTTRGAAVDGYINYDGKAGLFDTVLKRGSGVYNLNEEIRDLLVAAGIPKDEIAIIQDIDKSKGDKDANKSALFAKVRSGEVRVLIGSRPKMGEGTNVQERLAAIHLLHPGWKPAEDEQAIGRIIRYGNTYKEGQIFYYLTKGNEKIGSYETKNHQLVGGKGKLIDQVMHGDDTVREIDMDEGAMNRDMLMGLASGNKALIELIDVKKRVHKLELNTESTATSARRIKDKAEATARILVRRREEFDKEQKGAKEWREKNKGKPFVLSTPDGRSIDKVKDMADYIGAQMVKQLTQDRYDRDPETALGSINGVDMILAYDKYGDEKFRIAVPLLGVAREINYSGFLPDFSIGAMTAFKNKITEIASPDYEKAYLDQLADMDKQAKKMSADADKLQKDYEGMRDELAKLRKRQSELECAITPLMVQAVEDRKTAAYGNWIISKRADGGYLAQRETDAKRLSAPTVKELVPLMDAEDFANPRNAATKTVDLRQRLDANKKGERPGVDTLSVEQIDFSDPEFDPDRMAEYMSRDDKTPTEEDEIKIFGFKKEDVEHARRALGKKPLKHQVKPDEVRYMQAESLASKPGYLETLAKAVDEYGRPISDAENTALGNFEAELFVRVNDAREVVAALEGAVEEYDKIPEGERDAEYDADRANAEKELKEAKAALKSAESLQDRVDRARDKGVGEAARTLRSNRDAVRLTDFSYVGIRNAVRDAFGGDSKRITPEMDRRMYDLAKKFEELDEKQKDLAMSRLGAFAENELAKIKRGDKTRRMTPRGAANEMDRVTKNYNNAIAQFEVAANETGGIFVGLAEQKQPGWGKWLRQLAEFHCFENPDIKLDALVELLIEDLKGCGFDAIDEVSVLDEWTGYGHSFRQSRYESQRRANWLRSQGLHKRQLIHMDETNTMPSTTGMVRDEDPTPEGRALAKEVYERKKDIPDAGRDERRLKGALESIKTRLTNSIADLERAIMTNQRIPARTRTMLDDAEIATLRQRRSELKKAYDEMFGTTRTMTEAQRIALAEKFLNRQLELAMEDLARARNGDFSNRQKNPKVTNETIEAMREKIRLVREERAQLKQAKFEYGMTPDEVLAYNARRMANKEKAILKLQDKILSGDLRANVRKGPPLPPEQQKIYDEMDRQHRRAREKVAEMRLEAANATAPKFRRKAAEYFRFVTSAQRALRATMDFSAVLRQAARITLAHPVLGAKSFGKAWEAAKSDANLTAVNDEIMSDPTIQEAVSKYGLHLREVDAENARDVEMFHGMERNRVKVFGKEFGITDIPFFGEFMLKSERHYITYLNAASAELYSSIVNDRARFPAGATPWQKKIVADMINVWNGSAALSGDRRKSLQNAFLNDIFWAPQLAISRFQSAVGYDVWLPLVAKGVKNANGVVDNVSDGERIALAKLGLSERIKSTFAMLAIGALLKWMFSDDDDWYNFKQADWWEKMMLLASPRVGNTTIDLTGGESTFNRLVHQLATGQKRTLDGKNRPISPWAAFGRYLQGKASPMASLAGSILEGKNFVGEDYTLGKVAYDTLVPLTFEDIKDQFAQNGVGMSLVTAPLSLLGAGGSTYDRKPYENAVNRFKEAYEAGTVSKPEDAAKAMAAIKQVTTSENAYKKAVAQLDDADAKGVDTTESRKRLESVAQRIEEMKSNVLELIRASR